MKRHWVLILYFFLILPFTPVCPAGTWVKGTVPAKFHRPLNSSPDPRIRSLLKKYDTPAGDFPCQTQLVLDMPLYKYFWVTFPSPYTSPDPKNNTVWCEYFQSKSQKPGLRPAVIVLHTMENQFTLPRALCHSLASAGIDAVLMKMAYYGERRSKPEKNLFVNMDILTDGVTQTVMDLRRTAEFLAAQPGVDKNRIGVCGFSLGALVASLAIGVDGNFPKAVIVMGGADIIPLIRGTVMGVSELKACLNDSKLTDAQLRDKLAPIEPLNFLSRARNTQALLVNANNDVVIPRPCTRALAENLPRAKVITLNGDHSAVLFYVVTLFGPINQFFLEHPRSPVK